MRAGDLDKRGTIQYPAKSKNSFNEDIETWTDLVTIWCSINVSRSNEDAVAGDEKWTPQERISETRYKIRMRYRSGISTTMRLKYKNRYLQFLGISNWNEANKELAIMAKEVI
ncbi:MAG: phage head closure protein [Candidatus Babeliales bacterium]|jgi:SPP1 family predicted phage head-tail adaptor